ncbi:hypothetical protein AVEN_32442-1 [Araneus ventricosus]|uniref:Transposon Ty3-I Gag-Pol polyprotein n=1 Tax=Araneus ventricosus TaxID=182803 RepID=A0A4Y2NVZ3_ARAVE|nr:hypothetical protein AVEN_32442-1 [Araneus ventricosus]
MVDNGIIEESPGHWASPMVLVKKKDRSTRFCVDYRKLKEITKQDKYRLPRIDDTLGTLSASQWLSTLDLKSGYWQEPEGQIARCIQRLQEYDSEIQYRKGTSHGNADALSRRPCKESCKHCMNAGKKFGMETDISVKVLTTTSVEPWSSCEIQKAQLEEMLLHQFWGRN